MIFCISVYYASALSLHIESSDSIICNMYFGMIELATIYILSYAKLVVYHRNPNIVKLIPPLKVILLHFAQIKATCQMGV